MTDLDSFEKVKTWYFELRKYIPKEAPIIIAGNKSDLPNRTVPLDEAVSYAKEIGIEHVSASAKSGDNVNYVFNTLATSKYESVADTKSFRNGRGALELTERRWNQTRWS